MSCAVPSGPGAPARARHAGLPVLLALACALLASGASAASGREDSPRIVGSVTAAGAHLYIKRASTGMLSPLGNGAVLYLGDVIAAGPGATATVRLAASDASLPAGDDLISVYKQLGSGLPTPGDVGKEFGIAADATRKYRTLTLRRNGASLYLTLGP